MACHWSLFWGRWKQSTPHTLPSIILSFHLCLGLLSILLPSSFSTKPLHIFLFSHARHMPIAFPFGFDHTNHNLWRHVIKRKKRGNETLSQSLWTAWPWRWWKYIPLKCQQLFIIWHGITSPKPCIFSSTTVRTSNLVSPTSLITGFSAKLEFWICPLQLQLKWCV
jgi:hypothetical protein